jgi:hypothetical protein
MTCLPHFIATGQNSSALETMRSAARSRYGPESWERQILQVPWGSREWPSADYADLHPQRAIRERVLQERLAYRATSPAPLTNQRFGVSLDAEFHGFLEFEDSRVTDPDLIRAFRVRIAEIKAASGGRAEVYCWNVGAPDNRDGVIPSYISKVSWFLLDCGFDGWISAMVPQSQDPERLARRARRIVEAHDAVLNVVRSIDTKFKGFISMQPIYRDKWEPLTVAAKDAIVSEIGDRSWLIWCQTEEESIAEVYARGVAA